MSTPGRGVTIELRPSWLLPPPGQRQRQRRVRLVRQNDGTAIAQAIAAAWQTHPVAIGKPMHSHSHSHKKNPRSLRDLPPMERSMTDEVPGFRTIGSLNLPTETSPDISGSTLPPLPTGSATTGGQSLALRAGSSIGRPLGETGAVETLRSSLQSGDPSLTDQVLLASWRRRYESSPAGKVNRRYDGEYSETVVAYDPPPFYDRELAALLDESCRRADANLVTKELARLKVGTVGRAMDGIDMESWLMVLGDEIEEFPPDVIRTACRNWMRREKWTPSVAELREECNRLFRPRAMMRDAMRQRYFVE